MTDYILSRGQLYEKPRVRFCRDFQPFCRGIFRTNDSYLPVFATGNAAKELVKHPGQQEITLVGALKQYPYKDTAGIDHTQDYIEVYGAFNNQKLDTSQLEQILAEKEKYQEEYGIPPVKVYEYQFRLREIMSDEGGTTYAQY